MRDFFLKYGENYVFYFNNGIFQRLLSYERGNQFIVSRYNFERYRYSFTGEYQKYEEKLAEATRNMITNYEKKFMDAIIRIFHSQNGKEFIRSLKIELYNDEYFAGLIDIAIKENKEEN